MRLGSKIRPGLWSAVALLFMLALPAAAEEATCPAWYARFLPKYASIEPDFYVELRKQPISGYFPESEVVTPSPGVELLGAKIRDYSLKSFRNDFDALIEQRALIYKEPAKKFRAWLKKKSPTGEPYPDLNPVYLEQSYKAANLTLEDVHNIHFLAFAKETEPKHLEKFLSKLSIGSIGSLGLTITKKVGLFTAGALTAAVAAGPIAGLLNSLLSTPLEPMLKSAEQISSILFAGIAQSIQKFTSNQVASLKEGMSELANTTEALDQYNFEGMDHDEAKKIMNQFEERYYKIFLRVNGFMPSYKRAGRDITRDWLINQPLTFANHASTFETEFTLNRALLSALEEKIKARGTAASEDEQKLIEQFKTNMENAENRLAVTLASWKLFTFTYAEGSREDPHAKEANSVMMNTLGRYQKFMNLNKYRKELSGKIREAFHNFDPSFMGLERLQDQPQEAPQ